MGIEKDETTIETAMKQLLAREDMRVHEHNRVKDVRNKARDKLTVSDVEDVIRLYRTYIKPPTRAGD